jgi:hypothetical protein
LYLLLMDVFRYFAIPGQARVLLCSLLASCFLQAACADELRLKSGHTVSGVIDSETRDRITIQTSEGTVAIPRTQVADIVRDKPAENKVVKSRLAIESGDFEKAIRLIDGSSPDSPLRSQLENYFRDNPGPLLESAEKASAAEAARVTTFLSQSDANSSADLHWLLVRYLIQRKDIELARTILSQVPPQFFASHPAENGQLQEISKTLLHSMMEDQDSDLAMKWIEALARVAPNAIDSHSSLLVFLRDAQSRADAGDKSGAIQLLSSNVKGTWPALAFETGLQMVMNIAPGISAEQQIACLLTFEQQFSEPVFQNEMPDVYRKHANLLCESGHFEAAAQVALKLGNFNADAGARLQHEVEFQRRLSAIAAGDNAARYKLAVWARDMGLEDRAIQQFTIAKNSPAFSENATLQIELLTLSRQKQDFQALQEKTNNHAWKEAMKMADEFRKKYPDGAFSKKAAALSEVARFQLQQSVKLRPAEADALMQNVERLYFQEKFDEAEDLLRRIQVDYAGTPAAKKAEEMHLRIEDRRNKSYRARGGSVPVNLKSLRETELRTIIGDSNRREIKPPGSTP